MNAAYSTTSRAHHCGVGQLWWQTLHQQSRRCTRIQVLTCHQESDVSGAACYHYSFAWLKGVRYLSNFPGAEKGALGRGGGAVGDVQIAQDALLSVQSHSFRPEDSPQVTAQSLQMRNGNDWND